MCKILELNAVLRLYSSNFSNLHWNTKGQEMTDAHVNITNGFIDLCNKYIDPTGEMITRLGCNPLNYVEVIKLLETTEKQYLVVDSKKLYIREEIIEISQRMLGDIVNIITESLTSEEMEEPINAGIKSELEAMMSDFDIQFRYINNRRCNDNPCPSCENEPEENPLDTLENNEPSENELENESPFESEDNITDEICPECGNSPCTCREEFGDLSNEEETEEYEYF